MIPNATTRITTVTASIAAQPASKIFTAQPASIVTNTTFTASNALPANTASYPQHRDVPSTNAKAALQTWTAPASLQKRSAAQVNASSAIQQITVPLRFTALTPSVAPATQTPTAQQELIAY